MSSNSFHAMPGSAVPGGFAVGVGYLQVRQPGAVSVRSFEATLEAIRSPAKVTPALGSRGPGVGGLLAGVTVAVLSRVPSAAPAEPQPTDRRATKTDRDAAGQVWPGSNPDRVEARRSKRRMAAAPVPGDGRSTGAGSGGTGPVEQPPADAGNNNGEASPSA